MVQRYVLDQISDERLRLYVVWLPIHDTDSRASAEEATRLFSDPRVRQFWAPNLAICEGYKEQLHLEKSLGWDLFLVFPAGATWTEPVPMPGYLMHNLAEMPAEKRLDGPVLGKELEEILEH